MQLLKQLKPGLHVPNVAESVLQTSVSAVIFAAIVDRMTDTPAVQRRGRNRPTTTSKQALLRKTKWWWWCCLWPTYELRHAEAEALAGAELNKGASYSKV